MEALGVVKAATQRTSLLRRARQYKVRLAEQYHKQHGLDYRLKRGKVRLWFLLYESVLK